jgi:hydrogenase nickel incorporation protein HypA/HybF
MHELSIATEILRTVLSVAAEHGADRVEEVEVEVGAMRLVVPEALAEAFKLVVEGTPAEGARLKQVEVPLRGTCRHCSRVFEPRLDSFLCPGCGQAEVDILGGNDIILKSVVCTAPDGGEGVGRAP